MASPVRGMLDPDNAKSGFAQFVEGHVRVDKAEFAIIAKHQRKGDTGPAPAPVFGELLYVTRLDQEHRPLLADDGKPLTEILPFGAGSTSATFLHPALASGPEDGELEDAGGEPGAAGPTFIVVKDGWELNPGTPLCIFYKSLKKCGYFPPDQQLFEWAPALEGAILDMAGEPQESNRNGKKETWTAKVVRSIVRMPGASASGGGAAAAAKSKPKPAAQAKQSKSAANGSAADQSATAAAPASGETDEITQAANTALMSVMPDLVGGIVGQPVTMKFLANKVGLKLASKVNLQVINKAREIVQTAAWLEQNGVMQIGDDLIMPQITKDGVTFVAQE